MLKASEVSDLLRQTIDLKRFLPDTDPARYELTAAIWHLTKAQIIAEESEALRDARRKTNVISLGEARATKTRRNP